NEWLPDSAATAHVTNSTQALQQSQAYHGSDAVMVADGSYLPITHTGSTNLASSSGPVPLTDVLVCPSVTKSLLSVSKLTKDYPCTIEFDSDSVHINDKATKKLLIMGSTRDGLYCLEDNNKFKAFYSTRKNSASDEVWHRRLAAFQCDGGGEFISILYKGYRCLYPPTGRVYISRHVIFDETTYPFSHTYQHHHPQQRTPLLEAWFKSFETPVQHKKAVTPSPLFTSDDFPPLPQRQQPVSISPQQAPSAQNSVTQVHPPAEMSESSERTTDSDSASIGYSFHLSQVSGSSPVSIQPVQASDNNTHTMVTKGKAGITKPNPRYVFLSHKVTYPEPTTVTEALKHPGWNGAMTEEMQR
ncbi:unnamed protein product, partial [Arabidopsis halleri]